VVPVLAAQVVPSDPVETESGIGAPTVVEAPRHRLTPLEQRKVDLADRLDERDQYLGACRAADRELMARLNAPRPRASPGWPNHRSTRLGSAG
jgi:hypothetical protein